MSSIENEPDLMDDAAESKTKQPPVPPWAWVFVVICGAIPVIALGGAIPGALGAGGAGLCIALARSEKSEGLRVVLCSAVSVTCWGLFLGLAWWVWSTAEAERTKPAPPQIVTDTSGRVVEIRHSRPKSDRPRREPAEKKPRTDLTDESKRRELYIEAIDLRTRLEERMDARDEAEAKGRTTRVLDKQVEHVRGMFESRLDFMTRFHDITRQQLDDIIAEGDSAGWPRED